MGDRPKSESDQRTFYLAVFALLLSCVSFGVCGFNTTSSSLHKHIVVVDMNKLLRQKAAAIVHQQSKASAEAETELKLAEHARQIRAKIDAYAANNQVIVVAKGAVFGAHLKEITDAIAVLL